VFGGGGGGSGWLIFVANMLSAAETSRPLVAHGRGGEQWRQWVEGELLGGGPDVDGTEPGSAACGCNGTTVGIEGCSGPGLRVVVRAR
jgi:hypothetical protein